MAVLLIVALPVAAISALRGVWSPCGLSMLSSITPMTEAGRGNRFRTTAAWFVFGGVVGGLTLGALAAGGAAIVAAAHLGIGTRLGLAAAVAIVTAAVDLGIGGVELPIFKRQVNDAWLRQYRGWVYGAGFGWQIGFGVATYIMTAGVFLTIALAVVTASPLAALAIGATFGLVRGSAVFVARSAASPEALADVHRRLERVGPLARQAAAWIQVAAAATLGAVAWHPAVGIAIVVGATIVTYARTTTGSEAALSGHR